MIRIAHVRIEIYPEYQHDKAWRIGAARYHLSVPKPGSGVGPSVQLGRHVIAAVWLRTTRPLPCRWGLHRWGDSTLDTRHLNEYRADSMWQRSPCPRCNRRLHVGPVRATVAPADLEAIDAAVNELVAAQQRFKEALAKARGSRTSSLRGPLAKAVTAGLRLQELADVLGVSRERIRQVAERPQRRRSAR